MGIIEKSEIIALRQTEADDLEFVLGAEHDPENARFVGQWTREQHLEALNDLDILHLIVENRFLNKPAGYIIIAGRENTSHNIEFKRIVVAEKGKGYGREALRLVKRTAFELLNAHRLWLDVRQHNHRARQLYKSEGFVEEGVLRECVLYEGSYESLIVMSILQSEYESGLAFI